MKPLQVYLTESQIKELKQIALNVGTTVSGLLRQGVEDIIDDSHESDPPGTLPADPLEAEEVDKKDQEIPDPTAGMTKDEREKYLYFHPDARPQGGTR